MDAAGLPRANGAEWIAVLYPLEFGFFLGEIFRKPPVALFVLALLLLPARQLDGIVGWDEPHHHLVFSFSAVP